MNNTDFDRLYDITTPDLKTGLEFAIKILSTYEKEICKQDAKQEGTTNGEKR